MRRPADVLAQTQKLQLNQVLQRQASAQRLLLEQLKPHPELAAHRRKPIRRHHVDDADVRAHQHALRDEKRELRELDSIGPGQMLLSAIDEMADELIEESIELVVDELRDDIEGFADCVVDEVEEVACELAEDFMHLAHLS